MSSQITNNNKNIQEGAKWLDQTILQDAKRNRSDDQYIEASIGYNEDSRRDQHNGHRNGANNLTS